MMDTGQENQGTRDLILCVEDEPELRADIIDELRASGYEAIGADDGRQALDILETIRPDLILCDISMPGMDGYELLETVRTNRPDLGDAPFVFLTAFSARAEVISGKRSGADDYLVKPIDFDLMLASIEAQIAQARRMRTLYGVTADDAASPPIGMTAEVLDLLSFGIVLTDRRGEIAFANASACAMAEAIGSFSLRDRLRAGSADTTRQLHAHVEQVADAVERGDDVMVGMALPRLDGDGDLMAVICSLPGQDAGRPMAAIFLSDSAQPSAPPARILAELFGLTPAEAQVAQGLASGRRSSDIARDLNVSQTTVAFHLRNLFEKTGTNRQVDLVVLIMKTLAAVK